LPHIMAFSLINTVPSSYLKFAASGLKDTTRIASSDPGLWEDIFLTNNKELVRSLNKFNSSIIRFKKIIEKKDRNSLRKFLRSAKRKRDSLE
ncbi:MAG: prephenate dehydrogenase/arogenate dehydrogenase family protein, partial [Candidatus Omnitrophica bacterium]|nr:prephenate dehydrogenase/arogenate dehydrogenase family protein [Candidatus Omnitrophota bacterium]